MTRRLVALILAMAVIGGLVLSSSIAVFAHQLDHAASSAPDSGAPGDAEHQLIHALAQCEPGLAHFPRALAQSSAHPAPSRRAAPVALPADLQSSLRPPRSPLG